MNPELQTVIKQYNAVPEGIQQTVFYGEVEKIISEIANAYNLDDKKITKLENEVTLVLLLLQPPTELLKKLTSSYKLSEEDAKNVMLIIESLIFVPTFSRVAENQPQQPITGSDQKNASDDALPKMRTMTGDQESNYVSLDQDSLMKRDQS